MNIMRQLVMVLVGMVTCAAVVAQVDEHNAAPEVQRGSFIATFTERSVHSDIAAMMERLRWRPAAPPEDYQLEDETFVAWVPPDYDASEPYGLMVWVDAGPTAAPRPDWLPVLQKHRLIWIGANNSGNDRPTPHRFGMALDAAHNMQQRYHIDADRVYISGVSGGGRVSSMMAVAWADVFDGAAPFIGCNYFRRIPAPGDENKSWNPSYLPPNRKLLDQARQENRYVLVTGEHDFNRAQTKAIYEHGFVQDQFAHVSYIEVPGMHHTLPGADWLERVIVALDKPIAARREAKAKVLAERQAMAEVDLALARERRDAGDLAGAHRLLRRITERYHGTQAAADARAEIAAMLADADTRDTLQRQTNAHEAGQRMQLVKQYLQADRRDLARRELQIILESYGETEEAAEARRLLEELE